MAETDHIIVAGWLFNMSDMVNCYLPLLLCYLFSLANILTTRMEYSDRAVHIGARI